MLRWAVVIIWILSCSGPASAQLRLSLGERGLASLTHNNAALLANARDGEIRTFGNTPKLRVRDGSLVIATDAAHTIRDSNEPRLYNHYSWGIVQSSYLQDRDNLRLSLRVTNTSHNTIAALSLRVVDLTFAAVPTGRVMDTGMFGMGGQFMPLHSQPLVADSDRMPPVILVRFETGALAFAVEAETRAHTAVASIPFTSNPTTKLSYPLIVSFSEIEPGEVATAEVSLRFGSPNASDLANDVLQRYREAFPYAVDWPDRRAIGALFLATSQKHPPRNPRGWFLNAKDVDVTTPEGLGKWRARLLKYADDSIKILNSIEAQGMITWDAEGEEFASAAFYGDPRLAAILAPETEFGGALDEYFSKFRDAGLRTGITLRPQSIVFKDGVPVQQSVADPAGELLEKIEYANSRWGCTLFYLDSTYDEAGALSADVFRTIMQRFPDVLLIPENETFRDFAYTAPLNSFHHHGVTGTPQTVLDVYPQAFSALLVTTTEDKMKAGREALIDSVRRGDILIVNAWYGGKHVEFVKDIYRSAGGR
jgi:hypothetical protein